MHFPPSYRQFLATYGTEAISGARPSEAEIQAFERRLGGRLSPDYREFLSRWNGGRATASTFRFRDFAGKEQDSRVAWLFGLADDASYGLEANLGYYEGRVPAGFLPIGSDPFGNLILLAVASDTPGSVWFWDHEQEDEDSPFGNMSRVADSFTSFREQMS